MSQTLKQHKCVTHTRPRHVGRVRRAAAIFVTHIDGAVNNTADKLSLQVRHHHRRSTYIIRAWIFIFIDVIPEVYFLGTKVCLSSTCLLNAGAQGRKSDGCWSFFSGAETKSVGCPLGDVVMITAALPFFFPPAKVTATHCLDVASYCLQYGT